MHTKTFICVTGGGSAEDKIINGTYVHSKLIHHIATWVSVEFGDRVACILEDFVNKEFKETVERTRIALEAAENLVEIKQFAIEAQQQQIGCHRE